VSGPDLTPRELEVVILAGCLTERLSDKKIGVELGIGTRTVQAHMANGAKKITRAYPQLRGSARNVCMAWVRVCYHAVAVRIVSRHRYESRKAA
jgi:DNA-binding NarL/FixJ family response regulator